MTRIKFVRCFFAIVLTLGISTGSTASISSEFINAIEDVQEFSSESEDFGRYELILGKLTYQYPHAHEEVEGFRAEASEVFEGRVDRKVFDLGIGIGTLKTFSAIKSVIKDKGYNLAFVCGQAACGSVKGWSVFYPEQADGVKSDQYFMSAVYPKDGPPERVMAAHISMVGNRTRVTIDEVALLIDVERSIKNYSNAILNYWLKKGFEKGMPISGYDLGSAELKSNMKLKYRAIAELIHSHPGISVRLLGYTDVIGSEKANKNLSSVRAKTAARFLNNLGIPEKVIDSEGLGIFNNVESTDPDTLEPEHRKVVVIAEPTTAVIGQN